MRGEKVVALFICLLFFSLSREKLTLDLTGRHFLSLKLSPITVPAQLPVKGDLTSKLPKNVD